MKKYKLQTCKLSIWGEYDSEEAAIKELSDQYMQCSKCDPPNESLPELFALHGNNQIEFVRGNFATAEALVNTIGQQHENVIPQAVQLTESYQRTEDSIGKCVWLYVEEEIHGIKQFVMKYKLAIYPFRPEHWWKSENGFVPKNKKFRYEISNI